MIDGKISYRCSKHFTMLSANSFSSNRRNSDNIKKFRYSLRNPILYTKIRDLKLTQVYSHCQMTTQTIQQLRVICFIDRNMKVKYIISKLITFPAWLNQKWLVIWTHTISKTFIKVKAKYNLNTYSKMMNQTMIKCLFLKNNTNLMKMII